MYAHNDSDRKKNVPEHERKKEHDFRLCSGVCATTWEIFFRGLILKNYQLNFYPISLISIVNWNFELKYWNGTRARFYGGHETAIFFSLSPYVQNKMNKDFTWNYMKVKNASIFTKIIFFLNEIKNNPFEEDNSIDTHFILVNEWVDLFPQNE